MTELTTKHRTKTDTHMGGPHLTYTFPNGYGASVIQNSMSYGGGSGLWELGVLGANGHLTYETPITDDVEGYLTEEQVNSMLEAIAALPSKAEDSA